MVSKTHGHIVSIDRHVAGDLYVGVPSHHLWGVPRGLLPPGLRGSGGPPPEYLRNEQKRDFLASEQLIPASHMG